MMSLSIDLGTTAVKAAIVANDRVWASASVPTNAYVASGEQCVRKIVAALNDAVATLPADVMATVRDVSIADQMHGIVLWRDGDEGSPSRLCTWEDRRVPLHLVASLNRHIAAASGSNPSPPLLHQGYGVATLAALIYQELVEPSSKSGLLGGRSVLSDHFNRAGTIGAWLADGITSRPVASSSSSSSMLLMDVTDAASWGALDLDKGEFMVEAVAAGIAEAVAASATGGGSPSEAEARTTAEACLRRVLGSIKVVTTSASLESAASADAHPTLQLDASRASRQLGLTSLARLTDPSSRSINVHLSVGDHPASVLGAMRLVSQKATGIAGGKTIFVNCGTSLQAACIVDGHDTKDITLPNGCEVRPFFRMADGSGSAACLLLAASMNGGNVLAGIARRHLHFNSDKLATIEVAYADLEAGAITSLMSERVQWPAGDDAWPYPCLAVEAEGKATATVVRFDPRVMPERRVVMDAAGGGEPAALAASSRSSDSGSQAASSAAEYACAALSLLYNACALMLPASVWKADRDGPTTVVLTGSAFAKSSVMKRAAELLFERLLGSSAAYRLVQLSEEEAASCGALGAAATLGHS